MTPRNTTRRDKHRAEIAKDKPPCHWCGADIDYDAHHLDPLSFQIDHVVALANGGTDTLDNLVPAHRQCNRAKGAKQGWRPGVRFVTSRNWWSEPTASTSAP